MIVDQRHQGTTSEKPDVGGIVKVYGDRSYTEPEGISKEIPATTCYIDLDIFRQRLYNNDTVFIEIEFDRVSNKGRIVFIEGVKKPKGD